MPDVGIRHRVETRLDPATAGWVTGRPSGEPVMRAWVRFADGREPDPLGLITFADALPPTLWAMGRMGWSPTVQLQVLLRALPAPGWCLAEARAGEVADGWLDEDYTDLGLHRPAGRAEPAARPGASGLARAGRRRR